MGKDAAVANSETATSTLREQHVHRVVDAAQESHSAITRRNYLAAWRRFEAWADREGLSPIPALPETVAAYLAERAANGLAPASLRLDRAAIRHHHTDAGHANPADNEGVRRVLRGLTRRAASEGRTPKQAAALTQEGLAAIRETAQQGAGAHGTGRSNRAGQQGPPPRSGGYRPRIGHAGRHAAALRGRGAHVGRRGVSERRVPPASPSAAPRATRTAQGPPFTLGERPRQSFGRSIVRAPPRKPRSSDSVPVGPCRIGSPQQPRLRG